VDTDETITFEQFMDRCLYHPEHGYYVAGKKVFGPAGDFFTSPYTHRSFASTLAEAFSRYFDLLSRPAPFHLVELGAGEGLLGRDILDCLREEFPWVYRNVEYVAVDVGGGLPDSIQGVVFSNEFFDALPVHRVRVKDSRLREIYVRLEPEAEEEEGEVSEPGIVRYMKEGFPRWREGFEYEVNLRMLEELRRLDERMNRGVVLTIDYGFHWPEYDSIDRRRGTLLCYFRHQVVDNPYLNPGQQDMTAHVNFDVLEKTGASLGWINEPVITQREFLMQWGLARRLLEEEEEGLLNPERTEDRLGMKALLVPGGVSDTMKVLVQKVRL